MSTLNVSNITDGTTTVGTSYVVNGSAKAWVNFDGQGTIASRDSFNVSSLTDRGTAQYTVNFSTSMNNTGYTIGGTTNLGNGAYSIQLNTLAVGSVQFDVRYQSGGSLVDTSTITLAVHGDIA